MTMHSLARQITLTIQCHGLLPETPSALVLMVSGGADSVAMARLIPELFSEHHYTILHINHGLRGEASDADEFFVRELAAELGIECMVRCLKLADPEFVQGRNIEALGRELRYREALKLLGDSGYVLTAHTVDDRVETFLMRVIKGGGQGALAGIARQSGQIVRPLLDCQRQQLRDYLNSIDQPWREDASNSDTRFLRAFVRQKILPQMLEQNPQLHKTLGRSLDLLAEEDSFLKQLVSDLLAQSGTSDLDENGHLTVSLSIGRLEQSDTHPVILRRLLKQACEMVMPADERLDASHLQTIVNGLSRVGFATDIPGAVEVRRKHDTLVIRQKGVGELPRSHKLKNKVEGIIAAVDNATQQISQQHGSHGLEEMEL
ncbi:MAG: tRNA lysidine(34) synthetase TilS [Coriobacteriales bacterium]|nr:tRNA lysidine(34) synthetase TilS [Coriobacteriales bacterium]